MRILQAVLLWAVIGIAQADAGFDFSIQTFDASGTSLKSSFLLGETVTVRISATDNANGAVPNVSGGGVSNGGFFITADTTDLDDYHSPLSSFTTPFLTSFTGTPSDPAGASYLFVGAPAAASPVVLGEFKYTANVLGPTAIGFNATANNGLRIGGTSYNAGALNGAGVIVAVPEPSSLALMGFACAGFAFRRRRS